MKYQDPKQADTIMRVQQELDETKVVMHKTIESVLERGEKLDNLVERSNALSAQSKMFYKTAKKQNSCRYRTLQQDLTDCFIQAALSHNRPSSDTSVLSNTLLNVNINTLIYQLDVPRMLPIVGFGECVVG